jgi:hypothetical protein
MVVEGAVRLHGCLVQTLGARAASFKQVADPDQILPFVKRMLVKQSEFGALGKPCELHIALHYTRAENKESIRSVGLKSKGERENLGIQSKFNGAAYGEGVYTTEDPTAYFGRKIRHCWTSRVGSEGQ